jgi:carboxylate-amine ligase
MGEEQTLTPDEQLELAYEQLENARDFTVAVEEEFALLDPDTLSLVNRFEDLKALAAGTEVEPDLVGELIASEVEVRTGRCDSFADAVAKMGERRDQLNALTDELGVLLGGAGTHPWSPWQAQRIIDTPHYRRIDELLRYAVWRNNSFGQHVHVAVRGADRAVRVASAMRNFLPELLALSASSPFVEGVATGLHSARTQIFTRTFPRCGVPDPFAGWNEYEQFIRFLYRTDSIQEHTQLWWSVRVHLAFPTVEVRICDAQPDLGESRALAALSFALVARCTRALDEGEPIVCQPHRMIEENLWRAIRWGLSGEMIDLTTGEVRSTRAALEELIEWVMPVAEELGAAQYLAVTEHNSAERQIARLEEGASLYEIYDELVKGPERVGG